MSSSNLVSTLRGIICSMQKMKQLIGDPKVTSPTKATSTLFIPTLDLPFPQDILTSIDSIEFPCNVSRQLRQLVIRRVDEARLTTRQIFERTCLDVSASPCAELTIAHLVKIFQKNYETRCISKIRQQLDGLLMKRHEDKQINEKKKGTFRFEYTPLLEQYFEQNAYPTAQDRLWLAQRTKMSPRQIEVWFQNHRNRAKSQGKVLKRRDLKTPLHLSVASQSDTEDTVSSEAAESDWLSGDEASEVLQTPSLLSVLNTQRPPHAFPTPYPHKCSDDPFPHTNGIFHFATPVWSRRPRLQNHQHTSVDVNELADLFAAKLTLREATSRRTKKSCEGTRDYSPWFASIVTRPSSAPHPALIRKHNTMPPSFKPEFTTASSSKSSFSSTYSNCRIFNPPNPSHDEANSRKLSLLKRIPNTYQTPFDAYSSRCSSFSSTTSLDSISSTNSNEVPITPPLSPSIESHDLGLILKSQDIDAIFAFEPQIVSEEKTDFLGDSLLTPSSHPSLHLWSIPFCVQAS